MKTQNGMLDGSFCQKGSDEMKICIDFQSKEM